MEVLVLLGALLVGAAALVLWKRLQPKPRCPECRSREVGIVGSEPFRLRDAALLSGAEGGHTSILVDYRVTTKCDQCGAEWSTTQTRC